jgi:hypothetical protein
MFLGDGGERRKASAMSLRTEDLKDLTTGHLSQVKMIRLLSQGNDSLYHSGVWSTNGRGGFGKG